METSIAELFKKKIEFNKSESWILPPMEQIFQESYVFRNLQNMKNSLNSVKSKLNNYPLSDWKKHTARRSPSGSVCWKLKSSINAELVTKAWCKFYECINEFPIVPGSEFNSLHLCELPGAFITALNHYLHSHFKQSEIKWKWLASSLNPYHESNSLGQMLTDDRFLFHTLNNWNFGEDFTGNIIDSKNIEQMIKAVASQIGDVHLITADGSVDCIKTPERQEELVFELQYAEIFTALRILANQGNFLLKTFTLFEASTVNMIYLLCCIFTTVTITKPATSKMGNSEVYIICIDYHKNTENLDQILEVLLGKVGRNKTNQIFPISVIPTGFLNQIELAAFYFMEKQINAIELNILHFNCPYSKSDQRCISIRNQFCTEFFNRFNVRAIKKCQRIVFDKTYFSKNPKNTNNNLTDNLDEIDKRKVVESYLESLSIEMCWSIDKNRKDFQSSSMTAILQIYKGKPITEINNSRFVDPKLILLKNDIELFSNTDISRFNRSANAILKCSNSSNDCVISFNDSNQDTYGQAERKFIQQLLNVMSSFETSTVIFDNFIFLTHFAVSVLTFLLNNVYKNLEYSFNTSGSIILSGRKCNASSEIEKLQNVLAQDLDAILCVLDIKELHYNEFIDVLILNNNRLLCEDCKKNMLA